MAFDSVLPPFLHLLLLFFNVKLQQTTPRRSRALGPPVFSLRCCWIKAFFVIFIVCACCAQDAAGEELRGAAVLFRDSVWAGGHPAVQSARQFYSSGCQLQNRGEDQPAEVDAPRSAGNASPGFGEPDSGGDYTVKRDVGGPLREARDKMSVRKMLRNHAMTFDLLIDRPTGTVKECFCFVTDTVAIQEIHSFIFIQFLCEHIFHQICFFLCLWFSVPLSSPSLF